RRFQYEDGSLTALGRKRYGTKEEMYKDINKNYEGGVSEVIETGKRNVQNLGKTQKVMSDTSKILDDVSKLGTKYQKSIIVNNKDYSKISDTELRNRINRLNMERTYGDLTGDTKRVRSGSDWTREALQTT